MRGLSHIRRIRRRIALSWWSWHFRQRCSRLGDGLQVLGPCLVYGGGTIEVGDNLVVRSRKFNQVEIFVASGARLQFGDSVFLNQGVRIACSKEIRIGNGCLIADESVILDNDYHGVHGGEAKIAPVCLEDNVWLATRVIVLRGVTIGRGSVVGAGSVVTHSIPPFSFAAGAPARVIKSLESH